MSVELFESTKIVLKIICSKKNIIYNDDLLHDIYIMIYNKNINFENISLYTVVYRKLVDIIRKKLGRKHKCKVRSSIKNFNKIPYGFDCASVFDLENHIISKINNQYFLNFVKNNISNENIIKYLEYSVLGLSRIEIAKTLKITNSSLGLYKKNLKVLYMEFQSMSSKKQLNLG